MCDGHQGQQPDHEISDLKRGDCEYWCWELGKHSILTIVCEFAVQTLDFYD